MGGWLAGTGRCQVLLWSVFAGAPRENSFGLQMICSDDSTLDNHLDLLGKVIGRRTG
jgi:hypothetical protein